MPEQKAYAIKAEDAELKDNHFRGIAAFIGNVDEGGDVILPGAFTEAIPGFLKAGFVPIGHDWFTLPSAMPVAAEEVGNKFMVEAEFHSHQGAQDAKSIMRERLDKGLDVGLSIGFDIAPDGAYEVKTGEDFLKSIKDTEYDLKMLDIDGIKAHKGPLRAITKLRRLFEFSIVSVPMNPRAVATAAKAHGLYKIDVSTITTEREFEEFLRDAGFPAAFAKTIASTGYKALRQRDVEETAIPAVVTEELPAAETVEAKTDEAPPVTPTLIEAPAEVIYFTGTGRRLEWMH